MTGKQSNKENESSKIDYRDLFMQFSEITRQYGSALPGEQREIIRQLGEIIEDCAQGRIIKGDTAAGVDDPDQREIERFVRDNYAQIAQRYKGDEARAFRERLGLSRLDVSKRCGINPQNIGNYEGNLIELPRRTTDNVIHWLVWLKKSGFDLRI
jgi:hypothetical protein